MLSTIIKELKKFYPRKSRNTVIFTIYTKTFENLNINRKKQKKNRKKYSAYAKMFFLFLFFESVFIGRQI